MIYDVMILFLPLLTVCNLHSSTKGTDDPDTNKYYSCYMLIHVDAFRIYGPKKWSENEQLFGFIN